MSRLQDWGIPAGLVLLSVVPILAGFVRLGQIASGVMTPENARWLGGPVPGGLHIVAATVFGLLGAFRFAPGLWRVYPRWHRRAGVWWCLRDWWRP